MDETIVIETRDCKARDRQLRAQHSELISINRSLLEERDGLRILCRELGGDPGGLEDVFDKAKLVKANAKLKADLAAMTETCQKLKIAMAALTPKSKTSK